MSKTSTINCDLCETVVASKDCHCIFSRFRTKKPYITVPYNYVGVECEGDLGFSVNEKKEYHICEDCFNIIKERIKNDEIQI